MKKITGTAGYYNLETGFWGIVDQEGNKYLPLNMPEQLKLNGAKVRCKVEVLVDVDSIHQWGTPVKIVSFHTITP